MDKEFTELINNGGRIGKAVLSLFKAKEGLLEARNTFKDLAESAPYPGEILKYYSYGLTLSETVWRINCLLGAIKENYPTNLKGSKGKN